MQNTIETHRSSALVALEVEDLKARRQELQPELDAARDSYDAARKSVIARTAKTSLATKAKSDADALTTICEEVDEQIATVESELQAAEAAEERARKIARLLDLKAEFDEHFEGLGVRAAQGGQLIQKMIQELFVEAQRSEEIADEIESTRAGIDDLTISETSALNPKNGRGAGGHIYAWGRGHLVAQLSQSGEVNSLVIGALGEVFAKFSHFESLKAPSERVQKVTLSDAELLSIARQNNKTEVKTG